VQKFSHDSQSSFREFPVCSSAAVDFGKMPVSPPSTLPAQLCHTDGFELENVPVGGKELTFVQENGTRRLFDASDKVLAEGTDALEIK
jgi:hypothetical protein